MSGFLCYLGNAGQGLLSWVIAFMMAVSHSTVLGKPLGPCKPQAGSRALMEMST